ncbi:MAG: cytochrome c [Saprospiraceae bacterium]
MKTKLLLYISFSLLLKSCSPAEGNKTGHEYMPDMVHSVAYEANSQQYYSYHQWGGLDDYRHYAVPLKSVKGSIPRGVAGYIQSDSSSVAAYSKLSAGELSNNAIPFSSNGHKNYYYNDTEEDRTKASKEILNNAVPLTDLALEKGKTNYNIYCGICHGEKGDGNGYLVRDDGGKYPAQPANFLKDEFIAASEGRFYHAIMYGKNVMNGYSAKLSYTERWEVIHYIRSLQATSKNLKYTSKENSYSNSQAILDAKKTSATVIAAVPATVKK